MAQVEQSADMLYEILLPPMLSLDAARFYLNDTCQGSWHMEGRYSIWNNNFFGWRVKVKTKDDFTRLGGIE